MKSLFVFLYYLLLKLQSIKLPLLILCFNLLDRQLILTIFDGENLEHSIYFYTCPKDYIKAWYEYQCPLWNVSIFLWIIFFLILCELFKCICMKYWIRGRALEKIYQLTYINVSLFAIFFRSYNLILKFQCLNSIELQIQK